MDSDNAHNHFGISIISSQTSNFINLFILVDNSSMAKASSLVSDLISVKQKGGIVSWRILKEVVFVFILSFVLIALITTSFWYYHYMNFEASNISIVEVRQWVSLAFSSSRVMGNLAVKCTCLSTVVAYLHLQLKRSKNLQYIIT